MCGKYYPGGMTVITCKISEHLDRRLEKAASERGLPKSTIVRKALETEPVELGDPPSLYERMRDGIGCVASGIGDLATNPKHLEGYGRGRRRRA
jgi:predicted DNA-binding protein